MAEKQIHGLDVVAGVLIFAAQQAGLGVRDLIRLLEAGMSAEQLMYYLGAKLAERPI